MRSGSDMRIPVYFATPKNAGRDKGGAARDAWLVEDGYPISEDYNSVRFSLAKSEMNWHAPGCACCGGQSPAAEALARAFRARALGTLAWFDRLIVAASPAGEQAVRAAVQQDIIARARYVLGS